MHLLPEHAALDRLLERDDRALNVAIEDVRERDLGTAAVDDLVRDLPGSGRTVVCEFQPPHPHTGRPARDQS